jgi:xanthine/uracil permease
MSTASAATRPARAPLLRDAVSGLMWFVVIVPPAFGFWLVAGDLAGVAESDRQTLILASLLGLGLATLLQVVMGHRMPVFEGPASTYLAAVAVLSAGGAAGSPAAVTGGLLAAGLLVFLLGLAGIDRLLRRIFTPPVVCAFLMIVTLTVVPATVERAVGHSGAHPWGVWAAWISTAVVVAVAVGGQAIAAVRSYSLLAALLLGTLAYGVLAGVPDPAAKAGWSVPDLFPWGAPELSGSIVAPFVIAGLLASFNAIASINVMAASTGAPPPPGSERRGLLVHGGTQSVAACFGNVLGNVPRLESATIVQMLGNPRPRALAMAAVAAIALAFVGPAVALLARLPIPVSAALVAVVLGMMARQALRQAATFDRRRQWLVVFPAVAPTFVWLFVSDGLSEQAQLLANPMLIGVALAVALDHIVKPPRQRPATEYSNEREED